MKTFGPVIIAFVVFAAIVLFKSLANPYQVSDMGEGNLHSFMACFYYFGVLYFLVALLTQWIIIVPVWNAVVHASVEAKLTAVIVIGLICALAAAGVAHILSDPTDGCKSFTGLFMLMTVIQLAYWAMNFFVLMLIPAKLKKVEAPTSEEPES